MQCNTTHQSSLGATCRGDKGQGGVSSLLLGFRMGSESIPHGGRGNDIVAWFGSTAAVYGDGYPFVVRFGICASLISQ